MPYVNIRVAGKLSKEQKQNIGKRITKVVAEETGKPTESVLIFIDEAEITNVFKAGKPLAQQR